MASCRKKTKINCKKQKFKPVCIVRKLLEIEKKQAKSLKNHKKTLNKSVKELKDTSSTMNQKINILNDSLFVGK